MNILITGGAGYIGSHATKRLIDLGHTVVVIDNLTSGFHWAVDSRAIFYKENVAQVETVSLLLKKHKIETIIHFAAYTVVSESIKVPLKYYENNSVGTLRLLESCIGSQVRQFIFSSTAAVYGEGQNKSDLVSETDALNPINAYGNSKLAGEKILSDFAISELAPKDFRFVILRYFNVAGASPHEKLGQASASATHLIKIAAQAACKSRQYMEIFGNDYSTNDGTCVRDYIHVEDLISAHIDSMSYLKNGGSSDTFNCGYGTGFSVIEVIQTMKTVSNVNFDVRMSKRRMGDPATLIANPKKIKSIIGWKPEFEDIKVICKSAYEWEKHLTQNAKKYV